MRTVTTSMMKLTPTTTRAKTVTMHCPRQQQCRLQSDDGDHGHERVAEAVAEHDPRFADAPRPSGLDVVVLERLDDVHAHQPNEHSADEQSERQCGQEQMLEHVREIAPAAVDERVEQVDVGMRMLGNIQ